MMKAKNLLQGALMGGCLAGWASFVEACMVFGNFPYQTDSTLWASLLPSYLGLGAVLGALCALVLPWLSSKKAREANYNLHLGILILAGALAVVYVIEARFAWMSPSTRTTSPTALMIFSAVLVGCLALYAALYFLARTRLGWMMSCACSGLVAVVGLASLAVLAIGALLRPISPAKLAVEQQMNTPAEAPNVLFIVLDTLRADHLGAYGYHRATSPNLDAIAAEGILFEKAFSAAPWTLPSHASMFTGLHATTHGTGWEHPRLSDGRATIGDKIAYDFHTLSEELSERGYQTVGVSEKSWLTYDVGLTQGFENYFDYSIPRLVDNMFVSRLKRFGRRGPKGDPTYPNDTDKGGARVVDTALHWLEDGRMRDEDRPFFMFMNLNEAHHPYLPPADYWERFMPEGIALEDTLPPTLPAHPLDEHNIILGTLELTSEREAMYKSLYDAEILYQDVLLGRLFDGIREMELMEDTLIVVVADHGEEFAEIGTRVGHQLALTDTLIHVPLIMRYPQALPAGQRIQAMASTVDLFPTILSVIESQDPDSIPRASAKLLSLEGVSLFGVMQDQQNAPRDMVLAHYANPVSYLTGWPEWKDYLADPFDFPLAKYIRTIDVLRTADEKFFTYGDGSKAFLRLSEDPTEQSSEFTPIPEADLGRARSFELRLQQQLGSYRTLHEMLVGHMVLTRNLKSANRTHDTVQDMESLGYVGESSGDGTEAESALVLPPFMRLK
ncbi:MAG: sulfatase-like hydrolase/transferase [Planctomycetota bacterium]|nr:sulfatase-like hydrolase/transferase [Planctomycetota bacterium]